MVLSPTLPKPPSVRTAVVRTATAPVGPLLILPALALAVAAAAFAPARADAHAVLRSSEPAPGSSVSAGALPPRLRLTFNEALEPAFTAVRLVGPGGVEIAVGKPEVDAADPRTVRLALPPAPLAAGAYVVRWSATGRDGHRVRGEFGFTVRP